MLLDLKHAVTSPFPQAQLPSFFLHSTHSVESAINISADFMLKGCPPPSFQLLLWQHCSFPSLPTPCSSLFLMWFSGRGELESNLPLGTEEVELTFPCCLHFLHNFISHSHLDWRLLLMFTLWPVGFKQIEKTTTVALPFALLPTSSPGRFGPCAIDSTNQFFQCHAIRSQILPLCLYFHFLGFSHTVSGLFINIYITFSLTKPDKLKQWWRTF